MPRAISGAGAGTAAAARRREAEREFWTQHSQDLPDALRRHERGPDRNAAALFEALEPLEGATVLDFACGTGITSAWLAARGARVTGLDITPAAIDTARALCGQLGLEVSFVCADVEEAHEELPLFDRLYGQFALHHVDVPRVVPILAAHLRQGGRGAFLETVDTNPLFRLARRHLVGRFGVHRIGTLDEKPLGRLELDAIRSAFGGLALELGEMKFLRIVNRNLFLFRHEWLNRVCDVVDDALGHARALHWLSYHRGLVVEKAKS